MRAFSKRVEPSSSSLTGMVSQMSASLRQAAASFRGDGDDLRVDVRRAGEVLRLEQRVALLLQLDERLLDGAGLIFEIRLERDRRVVESVVLVGLLGGFGGGGKDNEQRGNEAGAEPCGHCFLRGPVLGRRVQDPYRNRAL